MADVVSPAVRSRMMAGIRGTDTRPEMIIRQGLHARGFRFRVHDRRLPGKPDVVLPRYRVVIQVNGCFWHGHECHLFKWPSSNAKFWREKIRRNKAVDRRTTEELRDRGWRVLVVWECALKGPARVQVASLLDDLARQIHSGDRPTRLVARMTRGAVQS